MQGQFSHFSYLDLTLHKMARHCFKTAKGRGGGWGNRLPPSFIISYWVLSMPAMFQRKGFIDELVRYNASLVVERDHGITTKCF